MNTREIKDTRIHLVQELQKLPQTNGILEMIEEAKAGEYHDFKNNKYDCGKFAAVTKLIHLGHQDLADRVMMGEFDEQPDEEDKAAMRKLLDPQMFNIFGL